MKVRNVIKMIEEDGWFLVVIEKANGNYSVYAPDLPGCVATGKTVDDVEYNMHEAIEMHIRGLIEDKLPVPTSFARSEYMAVAV
jgi:predicted RNase H-like HicB family nuclease